MEGQKTTQFEQYRDKFLAFQRDEVTDHRLYHKLAQLEKHSDNRDVLLAMSEDEDHHASFWRRYTGQVVKPRPFKLFFVALAARVFGYTFVLRLLERGEHEAVHKYGQFRGIVPGIEQLIIDEAGHEQSLIATLDEERLRYAGDVMLGLNDALVELTGSIAGFTLSMQNTRLIAMAGIITGIAATLSMAASNYLASETAQAANSIKSSLYTGVAYLVTVVLLVLPYLLFPNDLYIGALITMLAIAVVIIAIFNLYLSVARGGKFWFHFGRMAAISLGVAVISFFIGILAKMLLGVNA
ncbi:MAG: VIT1/CCC1 family protein [Coriobacteriales bacterium]|nr:VIT1/CCC1 family protein [Coriobacteriales bacterium]